MIKIFYLIILILSMTGCSSSQSKYVDYDNVHVREDGKKCLVVNTLDIDGGTEEDLLVLVEAEKYDIVTIQVYTDSAKSVWDDISQNAHETNDIDVSISCVCETGLVDTEIRRSNLDYVMIIKNEKDKKNLRWGIGADALMAAIKPELSGNKKY